MERTRVIIADDESVIRTDLREMLTNLNYLVVGDVGDGRSAVNLARELKPDVVIMDIKMPDMDGIEAAKLMTQEKIAPVLLLTAYAQRDLVDRAKEAGVVGYLVKPFREADLLPAIKTARARHEELAALRDEAESLSEALAARKSIERAKGLLMAKEGLTEQEAFERLRRASQLAGRPLKVVADALIATFESA